MPSAGAGMLLGIFRMKSAFTYSLCCDGHNSVWLKPGNIPASDSFLLDPRCLFQSTGVSKLSDMNCSVCVC